MHKKKLIEVALPLDAINAASAREKSIRQGHPSTLHLWWARRPLAAARAVIFAQMVDDPSTYVDTLRGNKGLCRKANAMLKGRMKTWQEAKEAADLAAEAGMTAPPPGPGPTLDDMLAELERERLFRIIEEMVKWENTTNEGVLQQAREEIWQSWRRTCAEHADHPRAGELFDRHKLPAFHDPFAGGGSLPLEAQRLGLEAHASDLNPVAVLINKAMIEIPPKFANMPPVNPEAREKPISSWQGAQGLAEDVRYYGKWMRDEAEKRIGHLYPKVKITKEMVTDPDNPRPDLKKYVGRELTVIAWIWARTVKSPNPAYAHVDVPLASTFMLSTKKGKEAYIEPVVEGDSYRFRVKVGEPEDPAKAKRGTKLSRGANFECVISGEPIAGNHIKAEGKAGRMGERLMAIVAEGDRGRVYLEPTLPQEIIVQTLKPKWSSEANLIGKCRDQMPLYGMNSFDDLFTSRQFLALTTFSDLIKEANECIKKDAFAAGLCNDSNALVNGGFGCKAYAETIAVYLSFGISRLANRLSTICIWNRIGEKIEQVFARQAIPMTWDFVEANVFSESTGGWKGSLEWIPKVIELLPLNGVGYAWQDDATKQLISIDKMVSTDPPYYDNINYADLSDFFYIWLRRTLRLAYPQIFSTLAVPKTEELVASTYRHGGRETAERFFLEGMTQAMQRLANQAHSTFPVTIYYAFKQSESNVVDGTASTGWETFLEAVILAGFIISGTWPIRTERDQGLKTGSNVLASSVVLVCRKRPADAPSTTRRNFINSLKAELPQALALLQRSNIAPVDLAQASIGPGMAVYTRYSRVLDAGGSAMTVREALVLINQVLDEVLAEQEGEFDADTRWALAWFEQYGYNEGPYGSAETLSKAKNTSVDGMVQAGIVLSSRGKVRILKPGELPEDWDPDKDTRLTVWEIVHQLLRTLEKGETDTAGLLSKLGGRADVARGLAYRLYTVCERNNLTNEALAYNGLVRSWSEVARLAQELKSRVQQQDIFGEV